MSETVIGALPLSRKPFVQGGATFREQAHTGATAPIQPHYNDILRGVAVEIKRALDEHHTVRKTRLTHLANDLLGIASGLQQIEDAKTARVQDAYFSAAMKELNRLLREDEPARVPFAIGRRDAA